MRFPKGKLTRKSPGKMPVPPGKGGHFLNSHCYKAIPYALKWQPDDRAEPTRTPTAAIPLKMCLPGRADFSRVSLSCGHDKSGVRKN